MEASRRYSEKEVGEILRRAGELQATEGASDPTAGKELGLGDLERIAAEVGIDPRHVRAAAIELESPPADGRFHALGAPATVSMERLVEGEITPEAWEDAVGTFRKLFADGGLTSRTGASMEWTTSTGSLSSLMITATPRNGRTKIQVLRDYSGAMGLTYVAGTASLLLASLVLGKGLIATGLVPLAIAGLVVSFFGTACFLVHRYAKGLTRKDRKKLEGVVDYLESQASPALVESAAAEERDGLQLRL